MIERLRERQKKPPLSWEGGNERLWVALTVWVGVSLGGAWLKALAFTPTATPLDYKYTK